MMVDFKGLPKLSRNQIELKAEEVITYFHSTVLERPQNTPIEEFVSSASKEFHIGFDSNANLGISQSGRKILGAFYFQPRSIMIDKSLTSDSRYTFVLAHEFGHFVLHRKLQISKDAFEAQKILDTEYDLATGKKILATPKDWLEWQANQFAAALLIPRKTIRDALVITQHEIGIHRNMGIIYLEDTPNSRKDFRETLHALCNIYKVTKTSMEYRLSDLGILLDMRDVNTKHISKLLFED